MIRRLRDAWILRRARRAEEARVQYALQQVERNRTRDLIVYVAGVPAVTEKVKGRIISVDDGHGERYRRFQSVEVVARERAEEIGRRGLWVTDSSYLPPAAITSVVIQRRES